MQQKQFGAARVCHLPYYFGCVLRVYVNLHVLLYRALGIHSMHIEQAWALGYIFVELIWVYMVVCHIVMAIHPITRMTHLESLPIYRPHFWQDMKIVGHISGTVALLHDWRQNGRAFTRICLLWASGILFSEWAISQLEMPCCCASQQAQLGMFGPFPVCRDL